MEIKDLAKKYKDYAISMRREFHMYPERSLCEVRTSQRIKEELDKMQIPYISAAGTGVVARQHGPCLLAQTGLAWIDARGTCA